MTLEQLPLSAEERVCFMLRSLYEDSGYVRYKMNKFEEYELYVRNKDFLVSDNIITFTDMGGKLMALKPDVTLSIVKNLPDSEELQRVYYNENVYRVSKGTGMYKEILQVGLECIGAIDAKCTYEVLCLAVKSLSSIADSYALSVSHMGVLLEIMDKLCVPMENREALLQAISEKSPDDIERLSGSTVLKNLVVSSGRLEAIRKLLLQIYGEALSDNAKELLQTLSELQSAGVEEHIRIDFSVTNDLNYYNGIVFKGYVNGISASVLSGGRYDSLLAKMGRKSGAIGFAVYLDFLDRFDDKHGSAESDKTVINIALPKGRLGEKVYELFEKSGYECPAIHNPGRKLIFENEKLSLRYFWVKPSDVAIYVERGAADIGVCGKDILLEYRPEVFELEDLALGKCTVAVAAKEGFVDDTQKTLRVATKFSNIAGNFYQSKGRDIDIIHLNGSIELAPILGLSDVIVDIVETGTTLKENKLSVIEEIAPISARLIANKSSYKFKNERIKEIASRLKTARQP